MTNVSKVAGLLLLLLATSAPAWAQNTSSSQARHAATHDAPVSTTFEVTHESTLLNAHAGLGVGLALPGFIAFQGNFATFGGIARGLYIDARFTGTTAGSVFGTSSPLWADSFEVDLRVGYGSRTVGAHKGIIRDDDKRKIQARIPSAFGVTPYIGWRGRWGYNLQQIRLGIHVERDANVEVRFTDARVGSAFKRWAFDFELSYSGGWQKGLGGQLGYDHWFNDFVYLRTELGYAAPNQDKFHPAVENRFTGTSSVGGAEGFWTKAMIAFAFRFNIPVVSDSNARRTLGESTSEVQTREHQREVSAGTTDDRDRRSGTGSSIRDTRDDAQASTLPPARTTGCQSDADCNDGVFCNGSETCFGGVCQPGALPDDGISCTQLVCDEASQTFRFEPLHGLCGDGVFCNGTELCDPNVGCVAGTPIPVDDGDPCTRDFCDEATRRVVNESIAGCDQ